MKTRKQSSTSYPITFLMIDSADHITGKTGLSPTVTISKNGAAFASPSGAVTELGSGWYQLAGNATDRNTLGDFIIHATATGADPVDERYLIVPFDPFDANALGMAYLTGDVFARIGAPVGASISADIATRLATSGYTAPPSAATNAAAVRTELTTELGRIDAAITTRMASGATVDLASTGLDGVTVESGLNARQALAIMASALAGVLSGAATTTITIKAAGVPATTRIAATVDSDGNRSALTLSPPA